MIYINSKHIIFKTITQSIFIFLREKGYNCCIIDHQDYLNFRNKDDIDNLYIFIGLNKLILDYPKRYIIYQFEQTDSYFYNDKNEKEYNYFFTEEYFNILKNAIQVWDYSLKNINWLKSNLNLNNIIYVPICYCHLLKIPFTNQNKTIDIYQQLTILDPNNLFFPLELVRLYSQEDNLDLALVHLQKAGEIGINYQRFQYPEFDFNYSPHIISFPHDSQISNIYLSRLSSIKPQEIAQFSSLELAILFYELGLLAHQYQETNLVAPFWKSAVYLAPEWSHFHVELANYYLAQGEKNKAQTSLEKCMTFWYPKDHCKTFLEENVENGRPEQIGFLKNNLIESIGVR